MGLEHGITDCGFREPGLLTSTYIPPSMSHLNAYPMPTATRAAYMAHPSSR